MKQIVRSRSNRVILGVAGGLAEYFDIDATIIRLIFVVIGLVQPAIIFAYFIGALVIPERPAYPPASRSTIDVKPNQSAAASDHAPTDSEIDRELEEMARNSAAAAGAASHAGDGTNDRPVQTGADRNRTNLILGAGLAALGGILLFREFIPWFDLSRFWPVLVIALGGLIVWRSLDR